MKIVMKTQFRFPSLGQKATLMHLSREDKLKPVQPVIPTGSKHKHTQHTQQNNVIDSQGQRERERDSV